MLDLIIINKNCKKSKPRTKSWETPNKVITKMNKVKPNFNFNKH